MALEAAVTSVGPGMDEASLGRRRDAGMAMTVAVTVEEVATTGDAGADITELLALPALAVLHVRAIGPAVLVARDGRATLHVLRSLRMIPSLKRTTHFQF